MFKAARFLFWIAGVLMVPLCAETQIRPELSAGEGTRDFSWSIAGPHGTPNIYSELNWKNLKTRDTCLGAVFVHPRFESSLKVTFATVQKGKGRDSDYHGNNRTDEWSRSNSDATGSDFERWLFLIGPRIGNHQRFEMLPQVGYLRTSDHYRMRGGVQIIPDTGAFEGLNSSYKARTEGFGGGLTLRFFPDRWIETLQTGWHRYVLDYNADANWNLRDDFRHFSHRGTASESHLWLEGEWRLPMALSAFVRWEQQDMSVENGLDTTDYLDGSVSEQSLRTVSLRQQTWLLGIKGNF